ncbi:peptide/nickel transport system permease protein [Xanthobacter sp. SG618]|uniref:ABC transporter permease n=1 Tax=Xanthobacter sp. SG618 TaxID=2587121 RepID=UPI00145F275A|nr:ABC transporter permease [Xanthobacter sp. SG618]NMN59907.1 peptide/nickel transport system permease protein [Xanthobacter sp. SG618]
MSLDATDILPRAAAPSAPAAPKPRRAVRTSSFGYRFLRSRTALAGSIGLALVAGAALFAGQIFPGDPLDMVARPFIWPFTSAEYPLGTDMLGRDILIGLVYAARVSLAVGLAAAGLAVALGVVFGALSGYFGGWVDQVLTRITEVFQTMPPLVFVVVVVAILTPSVSSIVLGIAVTSWPQVARLVRAEALRLRDAEFVQAARVMGMGHFRIILTHILPNAISPVVVAGSILVASAILTEAALSFLGLGDPNLISWGSMIGSGREVLRTAWYMTALPGLAISLTVMALNLLGNGLNDVLNPRVSLT